MREKCIQRDNSHDLYKAVKWYVNKSRLSKWKGYNSLVMRDYVSMCAYLCMCDVVETDIYVCGRQS